MRSAVIWNRVVNELARGPGAAQRLPGDCAGEARGPLVTEREDDVTQPSACLPGRKSANCKYGQLVYQQPVGRNQWRFILHRIVIMTTRWMRA
jgi:hypothetical protein